MIQIILNIFLVGALVSTILNIIFKRSPISNRLACGLFGYSGNTPPNMEIIKILGLYNEARGAESSGIAIDGEILKSTKKWSTFIQEQGFGVPEQFNTIIAHTRKSSKGVVTKDNAHPFEICSKNKMAADPIMIGAHNGTIHNTDALAEKYGFSNSDFPVDSKLLLSIIGDSKRDLSSLKVLNDYSGGAALVWYFLDEPEKLYVFKGASISYNQVILKEERPLFYYKVKGVSQVYISSLETALTAVADVDKNGVTGEIKSFNNNIIYCIVNGVISKLKVEINREHPIFKKTVIQKVFPKRKIIPSQAHAHNTMPNPILPGLPATAGFWDTWKQTFSDPDNIFAPFLALAVLTVKPSCSEDLKLLNFKKEVPFVVNPDGSVKHHVVPLNHDNFPMLCAEPNLFSAAEKELIKDKIYFWRGKYHRNGHIIGGGTCISEDNWYYPTPQKYQLDEAGHTYEFYTAKVELELLKKGIIRLPDDTFQAPDEKMTHEAFLKLVTVRTKLKFDLSTREFKPYWFVQGALVSNEIESENLVELLNDPKSCLFTTTGPNAPENISSHVFSKLSGHLFCKPTCPIGLDSSDGRMQIGTITPIFALRSYTYRCGAIIKITGKNVPTIVKPVDVLKKDIKTVITELDEEVNNYRELSEQLQDSYLDCGTELELDSELAIALEATLKRFATSVKQFEMITKDDKDFYTLKRNLERTFKTLKLMKIDLTEAYKELNLDTTTEQLELEFYNN